MFEFIFREVPVEELNAFLDTFIKRILELVKAGDAASKLGGILAIVALINADVCNTNDRISRFGNYIRNNCLPPNTQDRAVIELAAKAIARLAQVSGTYITNLKFELIDHEVKRAFELLSSERSEGKQYAAVLILREIAYSMPTFFFQNVGKFFNVIFNAVFDHKLMLRESSVNALRAGLVVTAQRETSKQSRHLHQSWYKHCFESAMSGFDPRDTPMDRKVHGSILVLAELFRCSNGEWERTTRDIEENILHEVLTTSSATQEVSTTEQKGGGFGAVSHPQRGQLLHDHHRH